MSASNITDVATGVWSWFAQWGIPGIVILVILVIVVLRFILGGHSSSSSSANVAQPPRQGGFPTSVYTGSKRLSDFSVKPEVYDFKVPSPKPDTSNLRKAANPNMDLASKLFIGGIKNPNVDISKARELFLGNNLANPKQMLDMDKARELFLPHINTMVDDDGDESEDSLLS